MGDFELKGLGGGAEESFGRVGESDIQLTVSVCSRGEVCLLQKIPDGEGAVFGRIHKGEVRAGDSRDGRLQKRIMGAAQNKGVDPLGEEWFEVALEHLVGDGILKQPLLDQRDKQGAGGAMDLGFGFDRADGVFVGAAGDRGSGADNADDLIFCGGDRGFGSRKNDTLDRNLEKLFHARDAQGGGGVAGDDDHLGALGEEEFANFHAVTLDSLAAFATVGNAGRIADVEDIFRRQEPPEAGGDGEAPDAGIKNANRIV